MSNFIVSPNLLNIFYADAFMYKHYGCLVMGTGKSDFSSLTTSSGVVIEDFCCLSRKGNHLLTHHEPYIIKEGYIPNNILEINTFIYCLSDDATAEVFGRKPRIILNVDYNSFFQSSRFNICFTIDPMLKLKNNTNEAIYKEFTDHNSRGFRFRDLTWNINNSKFLIIPWMNSALDKANLLKSTI